MDKSAVKPAVRASPGIVFAAGFGATATDTTALALSAAYYANTADIAVEEGMPGRAAAVPAFCWALLGAAAEADNEKAAKESLGMVSLVDGWRA